MYSDSTETYLLGTSFLLANMLRLLQKPFLKNEKLLFQLSLGSIKRQYLRHNKNTELYNNSLGAFSDLRALFFCIMDFFFFFLRFVPFRLNVSFASDFI